MHNRLYRRLGKRMVDLAVSATVLGMLSPLLGLVALLVLLDSPGPCLFVQDRLGRRGEVFRLLKFRTMAHRPRVADHEIVAGDPELTHVGRWLRRYKLDELPQLVNVLKGDMSLIGPRPTLPAQLPLYDETTLKRLSLRPGLTGLAQVSGNIYLPWPERWQHDCAYVERLSLSLDLRIAARTVGVVLLGEHRFIGKAH